MKRREFVAIAGGAALWPLAAQPQQTAMPMISYLGTRSPDGYALPALADGVIE